MKVESILSISKNNDEAEQFKEWEFEFSNLAPIDDLDEDNGYLRALDYALEDKKIRNIALSGTYGSGKSSIFASYQKSRRCSFVNISLATFGDERDSKSRDEFENISASSDGEEGKENDQEKSKDESKLESNFIEKSILQQLLYSVDATSLPYSRINRIVLPRWSKFKAFIIVFWLAVTFYLFQKKENIFNSYYFKNIDFGWPALKLIAILVFILGAMFLANKIHKKYRNFSLKKLSATGVEVEKKSHDNESFLSLRLDEIIYFFQTTKHKVVIFEDLDRFDKPEIFHKLREINKLVNDGCATEKPVKFIYAIKDDMFLQNDRTKFFDFIIPVIPIVNTSNSRDKFRELLDKCNLLGKIEEQLLRDISYYLNDLRLVKNIVNEFQVYLDQIPEQGLDKTKLLAMIVYKNCYAEDFGQLHQNRGVVFQVCEARMKFEEQLTKSKEQRIKEIQELINSSEKEEVKNVAELLRIYLAQIITHFQNNSNALLFGILLDGKSKHLSEFSSLEIFESLVVQNNFHFTYGTQPNQKINPELSFESIEDEINPKKRFLDRKKDIERRSAENRASLELEVSQLRQEILETRNLPLNDLIEKSSHLFDDIINKNSDGKSDFMLMQNLFYNGYIDENYNDLISLFHGGYHGKNDIAFLKTIRAHKSPNVNLKLENPNEVCNEMPDNFFTQRYVLNLSLMDYLLENEDANQSRLEDAVHFIATNFDGADDFISAFYTGADHHAKLVRKLSQKWNRISKAARTSSNSIEHICQFIKHVDAKFIIAQMNGQNELTEFIEKFGVDVENKLSENQTRFALYKKLGVSFEKLSSLTDHEKFLAYVIQNNMFNISADNIDTIFSQNSGINKDTSEKLKTANYTCIRNSGIEHLQNYVDENILSYVENVLLVIEGNTKESRDSIIKLLNDDGLNDKLREQIILKQDHIFDSFQEIPEQYMRFLLVNNKVLFNWENLSSFQTSDQFDEELMTDLLNQENVLNSLKNENISKKELDVKASESLSSYIRSSDGISDANYKKYINCLPDWYHNFPEDVSEQKQMLLVKAHVVRLTKEAHAFCVDKPELMSALIEHNQSTYFSKIDDYPINDKVREMLLSSSIEAPSKLKILETITPQYVIDNPTFSRQIASLIVQHDFEVSKVDDRVIEAAIVNAEEVSSSIEILLSKLEKWDASTIMRLISSLSHPYKKIGIKAKMPKIPLTTLNEQFASALEEKNLISSYKITKERIQINTHRK